LKREDDVMMIMVLFKFGNLWIVILAVYKLPVFIVLGVELIILDLVLKGFMMT
jgi:hypothetical protein